MKHPLDVEKRRAYARMQICKFVTKQTEEKAVSCRWSAWDVVRQKAVKSWGPRRSLFSRSDDEAKEQKKEREKRSGERVAYPARFKHASYNTRRERSSKQRQQQQQRRAFALAHAFIRAGSLKLWFRWHRLKRNPASDNKRWTHLADDDRPCKHGDNDSRTYIAVSLCKTRWRVINCSAVGISPYLKSKFFILLSRLEEEIDEELYSS